jgi:hypothetical protein
MKTLLSALAVSLLVVGAANAQTSSESASQSVAATHVATTASNAGNSQSSTYAPVTNNTTPANTSSTVTSSGHLYTTPSVPGGAYFGGANPCLVGYGAGGAGGPIGLSLSFSKNDEGCTRRSDAAAWHALGYDDVAIARMTQDDDNLKAWKAAGHAVASIPAPVAVAPVASTAVPAPVVTQVVYHPGRKAPDWCANAVPSPKLTAAYIEYACGE